MTSQIDEILALLSQVPARRKLVPGELMAFVTEIETPVVQQYDREREPRPASVQRMAEHDALPAKWRLLVHEHGTSKVMAQWQRLRSKDAEKARQAIEVNELMRAIQAGANWRG